MGRHVRVHTDHKALQFISSCTQHSERIARWVSFLQAFDLEVIHIPGKENVIADALSRNHELDNCQSQSMKEKHICWIMRSDDGMNTRIWIDLIQTAQNQGNNLLDVIRQEPGMYYA